MQFSLKLMGAVAAVAMMTAGAVNSAHAQSEWPSKTITWIVPYGAGGGTDRWSRILAGSAADHFNGHGWHVRNRPGGSGVAGWKWLLDRPADGHSILINSATPVIALALESKPSVNPVEDVKICAFVSAFRSYTLTLKDSPYQSVDDVVTAAKAGKKITLGGTQSHLLGQANFWSSLGVELTYVGYDGTGQANADFLGGHVDLAGVTGTGATGLAPEKATILVNTSELGNPEGLEDAVGGPVKTAADYNVEGLSFMRWVGVHPDTSDDICQKISDSVGTLVKDKAVTGLLKRIKEEVIYSPMEEAQQKYKSAVAKFQKAAALLK